MVMIIHARRPESNRQSVRGLNLESQDSLDSFWKSKVNVHSSHVVNHSKGQISTPSKCNEKPFTRVYGEKR